MISFGSAGDQDPERDPADDPAIDARQGGEDHVDPTYSWRNDMATHSPTSRYGRLATLAYGFLCYAVFFGVFLYSIAFIGNFDVVPKTIDTGESGPFATALLLNLGLLSLFAVQHSLMARPAFKAFWTKIIPEPIERSTYVLFSSLCLIALFAFWQPLSGPTIWQITPGGAASAVIGVYLFGWAMLLYAIALIGHFELFGVRQVWYAYHGEPYPTNPFVTPGLYKRMRHPIYVAWTVIFWATPSMSAGHLFFAVVTTTYMILAVFIEERDLVDHFGDAYRRYQETTPKFFPKWSVEKAQGDTAATPA
jgi:protein-S-isoprenylcysteine O-methyltransferase Ste14